MEAWLKTLFIIFLVSITLSGVYVLGQINKEIEWKIDCEQDISNYQGAFIYSSTCPYCKIMAPLVKRSKMNWYWVDRDSENCTNIDLTEFGFENLVPHFYCIKTDESHKGTLSRKNFTRFVGSCGD